MALTPLNGFDGAITMPTNHAATIKVWQADISRVISDVTKFSDTGRSRITGLYDLQGSCSGVPNYDAANSRPGVTTANWSRTGSNILLSLQGGTACQYSVTAVISNISHNVDKGGDSTISFNFQNSGGTLPTESWDETP